MKTISTVACALLIGSFSATFSALADDLIEKSFDLKAGGNLHMKVDRGNIKVRTGDVDKVHVKVVRKVRGASEAEAQKVYDQHQIEFSQDGDTLAIETEGQKALSWTRSIFNKLNVEYTVTVPPKFNLELQTAGGNVEVDDLEGRINAKTSGGNITLSDAKGDVDLHTSGGNLNVGNITGNLNAKTSGGNISVAAVKGALEAQTHGGSIKIGNAAGPVRASSSGGNVFADFAAAPAGDCVLKTSGGNVKVGLPDASAVNLDARTSGGRVSSDFDGEFNKQRTKLVAKVNGGGPNVTISTSGGNVDVRRK